MKKIITSLFLLFLMYSCESNKASTDQETNVETTVVPVSPAENLQKVTYVSATYYTGRTDFYFTDETGERVEVGISNFPEDNGAIYPKELLESTDTTEGPPSENPAMVGKQFFLVKDSTGKLIEIRAVN